MIDCLCFLRQNEVEHNDIRQGTIIVKFHPLKVLLAGFSKCTRGSSSLEVDITAISKIYRSVALDICDAPESERPEEGHIRGDPEVAYLIHRILSAGPNKRLSAADINRHIHGLVGKTLVGVFAMITAEKSWQLKIYHKDKEIFVEVGALLDRLLAQRRELAPLFLDSSPAESLASKYLRDRQTFDGVAYCTIKRALKFCRAYKLEEFKRILKIEISKKPARRERAFSNQLPCVHNDD